MERDARAILEGCRQRIRSVSLIEARADLFRDDGTASAGIIREAIEADTRQAREECAQALQTVAAMQTHVTDAAARQIIAMRYVDGLSWDAITSVIFGARPDFYDHPDAYKRRVFRIHARTLCFLNSYII